MANSDFKGEAGQVGSGHSGPWVSDRSFVCSSSYNKKPLKYLRRRSVVLKVQDTSISMNAAESRIKQTEKLKVQKKRNT